MSDTAINTPEDALNVLSNVIDHLPQSSQIFLDLRELITKQENTIANMTRQIVLYRNIGNDRVIEILQYIHDAEFENWTTKADDIQEWHVYDDESEDTSILNRLEQYGYIMQSMGNWYITSWGEIALSIDSEIEQSGEPE